MRNATIFNTYFRYFLFRVHRASFLYFLQFKKKTITLRLKNSKLELISLHWSILLEYVAFQTWLWVICAMCDMYVCVYHVLANSTHNSVRTPSVCVRRMLVLYQYSWMYRRNFFTLVFTRVTLCMYVCMYVCLFAQAITDVQCEHWTG